MWLRGGGEVNVFDLTLQGHVHCEKIMMCTDKSFRIITALFLTEARTVNFDFLGTLKEHEGRDESQMDL